MHVLSQQLCATCTSVCTGKCAQRGFCECSKCYTPPHTLVAPASARPAWRLPLSQSQTAAAPRPCVRHCAWKSPAAPGPAAWSRRTPWPRFVADWSSGSHAISELDRVGAQRSRGPGVTTRGLRHKSHDDVNETCRALPMDSCTHRNTFVGV